MQITSKFNVSDLVQSKYQRSSVKESCHACYEVMEVLSQTCYGGTQIFYLLRSIYYVVETSGYGKDATRAISDISVGVVASNEHSYIKMREDELKLAPEQVQADVRVGMGMI